MWPFDGLIYPEIYGLMPVPKDLSLSVRRTFFSLVFSVVKAVIKTEEVTNMSFGHSNLIDIVAVNKFIKKQK